MQNLFSAFALGAMVLTVMTASAQNLEKATFAGGCFWCMEAPFEEMGGVTEVISGYAGGAAETATYEQVSAGKTAHREVVQVTFDPAQVSYKELLGTYFMNFDPTDSDGQFCDRGSQYTAVILAHNPKQKAEAASAIMQLAQMNIFDAPIVTPIGDYKGFFPAEDYHQNYYRKNLVTKAKYKFYKYQCGRTTFLSDTWGSRDLLSFN